MIKIKINKKVSKLVLKNRFLSLFLAFTALFLILIFAGISLYFRNRILPGVSVLNYNLSGKNRQEAVFYLSQKVSTPEKIEFASNEKTYELKLQEISLTYDFEKTVNESFMVHRKGFWPNIISGVIKSAFRNEAVPLYYSINHEKLNEYLQVVSEEVLSEPTYPSVGLSEGEVIVEKGVAGEILDKEVLLSKLDKRIKKADFSKVILPLKAVDPSLTDEESLFFEARAKKYLNKTLILKNDYDTFSFDSSVLLSFLNFTEEFDVLKISDFIAKEVSTKVERQPQNAVLRFENGKVTEFVAAKDGLTINSEILVRDITDNLTNLENSEENSVTVNIPVVRTSPEVTLNEVNNLGIKEMLGRGSSKFKGSIAGRVHNISLASSKFNGALVKPDEVFSFNNTLGDVSTFTGYKQAYIIKDGRTVLGDGGGVCQVSTTLFRAILDAGLPVVERRAHSYRVGYYEQDSSPGLDATVFAPSTDLKFINDTAGHLLIQTAFDAQNHSLIFEIYGTHDGRVAKVTKPVILSSTPPPEDLYIDDPNLPAGTVKQIDYKSWGAKVVFDYTVIKAEDVIIEETFVSNYRPWQAVYLRGTGSSN